MHVGERDAFLLLLLYGTFIHNPRLFVYKKKKESKYSFLIAVYDLEL
jgi:hypothetical protein